ncbi:MAG: TrkA C-terminal domain-containing protein [Acidimicrobiales bacterium]
MVGLISLFIVVITSLLITRVATVMLTLTGLSRESAKFQARSAFSGVGFTTSESESVVNHPLRRRIVMALILLGNAGVVTVVGSLLLSFGGVNDSVAAVERLGLIAGGLVLVWLLARSSLMDRVLSRVIERTLRRFTDLDARDYVAVLRLAGDWVVSEIELRDGDWLCDVPLRDLDLPEEGVVVLGIDRRDGRWVGAPSGKSALHGGDVAVLYGTKEAIHRLDGRQRSAEGELDRIASQIEFTEKYLEQQELERLREELKDAHVPEPELVIDDTGPETAPSAGDEAAPAGDAHHIDSHED